MPMYWGDYTRDTGHLNATSHGAYLMLIKHYWVHGQPLVDDDDELWRTACCDSKREWMIIRPKIIKLFTSIDGLLHHKRVEKELNNATAMTEQRRKAGIASAAQRALQREPNARSTPVDFPLQQNGRPSPSQRKKERTELRSVPKKSPRTPIDPDWKPNEAGIVAAVEHGIDMARQVPQFINHHLSKGNLMADWDRAWLTWCGNDYGGKRGNSKPSTPTSQYVDLLSRAETSEQTGPILDGDIVQ